MEYVQSRQRRFDRRDAEPAADSRSQVRVSPVSPHYYLGIPAHVWVGLTAGRGGGTSSSR